MERVRTSQALRLLRSQSKEYAEYVKLKAYVNHTKKKLYSGKLSERGSYNYFIQHEKYKDLKHRLKEQGLI